MDALTMPNKTRPVPQGEDDGCPPTRARRGFRHSRESGNPNKDAVVRGSQLRVTAMLDKESKRLILCAGLQSSGTTLVSWCFLQRLDTNGVLDMPHDTIQVAFEKIAEPIVWCKMTIGAFRWLDVCEAYGDLGWQPEPLLVVRDVRAAFSSLIKKEYGFNGTTAEEPPLRMRFRRFLRGWELFRANGWPILKYEDFIQDGRGVLRQSCQALAVSWDEGAMPW